MKRLKYIFASLLILILGFYLYKCLTVNGNIIPIKITQVNDYPKDMNYQIITFRDSKITLPKGWVDKGFRTGGEFGMEGKFKNRNKVIYYSFGPHSKLPMEPLKEYLYENRNDKLIMGNEITTSETDSSRTVKYEWPITPVISDTLSTGILNDSLRKKYPAPHQLYKDCNYYSFTSYHDSIYLVHIEVPDIVLNSVIENHLIDDHQINVIKPKFEKGITQVTVQREGFWRFSLHTNDLDKVTQDILIKAGLSFRFVE